MATTVASPSSNDFLTSSALVLIDLQQGIAALPVINPAVDVLNNAARLADAFRRRTLPILRTRVAFSPDGGDVLTTPVDAPPPAVTRGPDFATLCPEVGDGPTDLHIVKRQWDAFYGTELDLQLRRRGITTIVYAGIATSIGVESTGRHGRELGYRQAFVADAMTDVVASAQENSLHVIFPQIGQVAMTADIVGSARRENS